MTIRKNILFAAVSAIALGAAVPAFAADDKPQDPPATKAIAPEAGVPGNGLGGDRPTVFNQDKAWLETTQTQPQVLAGADVVNMQNQVIGQVESVTDDTVVVSVDEKLGMGSHTVTLDRSDAKFYVSRKDDSLYRVAVDMTPDQLRTYPGHKGTMDKSGMNGVKGGQDIPTSAKPNTAQPDNPVKGLHSGTLDRSTSK